jgi:hypothetical protein
VVPRCFQPEVRKRPEALTVLHGGAGWGPRGPTGFEYGALLARKQEYYNPGRCLTPTKEDLGPGQENPPFFKESDPVNRLGRSEGHLALPSSASKINPLGFK